MNTPLVPSIASLPAQYRGPSSSADYNTLNRAAYTDVIGAYAALQTVLASSLLANEVLTLQFGYVSQSLDALQAQVDALQESFNSLLTLGSSSSGALGQASLNANLHGGPVSYGGFPSYYPPSAPLATAQRASYAPGYGQITPHLSAAPLSKAYITDLLTGQLVTPPGVASSPPATVNPTVDPFSIEENDITAAVDGLATTYWRRNLYFSTSSYISDVTSVVTLTVPEAYVSNQTCNYVTIHPYPEFGVDIVSVVLHGPPGSGDIQLLPVDSTNTPQAIARAGKQRFVFADRAVSSVEITLRASTPNYTMRPGLQCFTLGASVLDFGSMDFGIGNSRILVPFTLGNNFFQSVSAVAPVVPGVSYQLFYLDPSGNILPTDLAQVLPGYVSTIYVEALFAPNSGALPVIDSLQVQFTPIYTRS